tara:strand:+ start:3803 stop:3931 length:129 start_codon:yes stop_codon:yes gene_type:complete
MRVYPALLGELFTKSAANGTLLVKFLLFIVLFSSILILPTEL